MHAAPRETMMHDRLDAPRPHTTTFSRSARTTHGLAYVTPLPSLLDPPLASAPSDPNYRFPLASTAPFHSAVAAAALAQGTVPTSTLIDSPSNTQQQPPPPHHSRHASAHTHKPNAAPRPRTCISQRELHEQVRHRTNVADLSRDIDNDGFVSQSDYYISAQFGAQATGKLTDAELQHAREQVEAGFTRVSIPDTYMNWQNQLRSADQRTRVLHASGLRGPVATLLKSPRSGRNGTVSNSGNGTATTAWDRSTRPPKKNIRHMHLEDSQRRTFGEEKDGGSSSTPTPLQHLRSQRQDERSRAATQLAQRERGEIAAHEREFRERISAKYARASPELPDTNATLTADFFFRNPPPQAHNRRKEGFVTSMSQQYLGKPGDRNQNEHRERRMHLTAYDRTWAHVHAKDHPASSSSSSSSTSTTTPSLSSSASMPYVTTSSETQTRTVQLARLSGASVRFADDSLIGKTKPVFGNGNELIDKVVPQSVFGRYTYEPHMPRRPSLSPVTSIGGASSSSSGEAAQRAQTAPSWSSSHDSSSLATTTVLTPSSRPSTSTTATAASSITTSTPTVSFAAVVAVAAP